MGGTESLSARVKEQNNYLGCKAFVRLYKSCKKGTITVTQVDLDHSIQPPNNKGSSKRHPRSRVSAGVCVCACLVGERGWNWT